MDLGGGQHGSNPVLVDLDALLDALPLSVGPRGGVAGAEHPHAQHAAAAQVVADLVAGRVAAPMVGYVHQEHGRRDGEGGVVHAHPHGQRVDLVGGDHVVDVRKIPEVLDLAPAHAAFQGELGKPLVQRLHHFIIAQRCPIAGVQLSVAVAMGGSVAVFRDQLLVVLQVAEVVGRDHALERGVNPLQQLAAGQATMETAVGTRLPVGWAIGDQPLRMCVRTPGAEGVLPFR